MTRTCTTCQHPERNAIDRALVAGAAVEQIARQYPPLSATAIRRHKAEHLHVALLHAREVADVVRGDDLLDQVRSLHSRTLAILDTAEGAGELRTALGAIREARGCIELLAKLLGEIQEGVTLNVLLSPEWARLRAVIVEVLEPYDEARNALIPRLLALEAGAV